MDNLVDFDNGAKTITLTIGAMNTLETKTITTNIRLNAFAAISTGKTAIMVDYIDGTSFSDFEILYLPINISTPVTNANTTMYSMGYKFGARDDDMPFFAQHFYDDNNSYAISFRSGNFQGIGQASQLLL